jgi:hypothetical protein
MKNSWDQNDGTETENQYQEKMKIAHLCVLLQAL